MSGRDIAGQAQHEGDRVLGGRNSIRRRGVNNDETAAGSGFDVDVVDAGAGASDHEEVAACSHDLFSDLRFTTDDEAMVAG